MNSDSYYYLVAGDVIQDGDEFKSNAYRDVWIKYNKDFYGIIFNGTFMVRRKIINKSEIEEIIKVLEL